jgi:hypothetical protein
MLPSKEYKGFEYPADHICKFIFALDFFTIMLIDGKIIHFTPDDPVLFRRWLTENKIEDIGILV